MNASHKTRLMAAIVCCGLFGACQIPRAKLANLHEVHSPSGQVSYRGRVQNDLEYALTRAFQGGSIRIEGLADFGTGEVTIEDPLGECLDNQLALAGLDSSDSLVAGFQVEAFGWLSVDDQYVLGRERAMLELGKHAIRLGVEGPAAAPEDAATAELLSPLLAGLAKAGLGALPAAVAELGVDLLAVTESEDLAAAMAAVREVPLDRNGALRVLAVCNVLIERSSELEESNASTLEELGKLQEDMQRIVVSQALGSGMDDPAPEVRRATLQAFLDLPGGIPLGLMNVFATDPDKQVVATALGWVAANGLPAPKAGTTDTDAELLRLSWIDFLIGQSQSAHGIVSAKACAALSTVSDADFTSMRAEDWTAWWRIGNPGKGIPQPVVRATNQGTN
ncbi:MAG: hypothetical protein ACJAZ8_001552 [Planctomycetota bacterium]|jgi:hypothetical protein